MLTISKTASTTSTSTLADPTPNSPPPAVHRFECRTCPYQYVLDRPHFETKHFSRASRKQAADILSGEDAMKTQERVEINCKNDECESREAAVVQVQIRSADEPMTSFFTCTKCGQKWREN